MRSKLIPASLLADQATEDHVSRYAAVDPASTPPTPLPHIVRMIHCALAARSRDVPEEIRKHVLTALHSLLTGPEMTKIIATNCLASVQVLMLLSMCDDLNGSDAGAADGAVWRNVGTAIRIATYIVSSLSLPGSLDAERLGLASQCITQSCSILSAE